MSKIEAFLTANEELEIVNAIVGAEKNTSGEIRVHIEPTSKKPHFERAQEVFHFLKMDNTKEENGVLIYIAITDKKFVIYGDKGIDRAVPDNFWDNTKTILENHFKKGDFKQGIIEGIYMAGKELETHFPWRHNNTNELSNEVSKG
ncbi:MULTISPECIES: TPM domain-containing protein [unclassified Arenibacter]|uniref:TPM domain-containing protein n=1 Tax=unclassified Arenibacter TaxID=2615047 RepID=UPI000E34BA0F|nr:MULTISPECIES: TPM domain-containing protein [unclassified Arenibacter]MCM4163578.1 hypothetical protein [Arenibacter sp. A80]RFT56309.1 TPM domain-containing protein [Arenibacter sp. P308M17]